MGTDLAFVLGTRPEIIKLSPVIRETDRRGASYFVIHTGQHYSDRLDSVFFEQLQLEAPEYNLEVGSRTSGVQTGEMVSRIEPILLDRLPETLLVQGDTNSVLAGSIAASKIRGVDLGHVEAGLRSYNRSMPEEINRRIADHVSDYLFTPTETSRHNLLEENIDDDRITVTGNTIVDAIEDNIGTAAENSTVRSTLGLSDSFALLTAHREENVDDRDRFSALLEGVARAGDRLDLSVVYPAHPRAQRRISEFDLEVPSAIRVVEPQNFFDFLVLQNDATVVFTDSGGVQEESCILGTGCVTLRDETERPETVDVGANVVVGTNPGDIVEGARRMVSKDRAWDVPFGDGTAAETILDSLGLEHHD